MVQTSNSPLAGDRLKKAVRLFCELIEQYPDKTRQDLLHRVQLALDLTPIECEFLNNHLADN